MFGQRILAIAAGAAAVVALGAGSALASTPRGVDPGTLSTNQGEAGYYTQQASFGNFSQADATFTLSNAANLGVWTSPTFPVNSTAGAIGTQLCDSSSGHAAQIGVLENGKGVNGGLGTYTVAYSFGTLAGGVNGDPCVGAGLLNSTLSNEFATPLTAVPAADSVQVQLVNVPGDGVLFHAREIGPNGSLGTGFGKWINTGWNHYNEVGDGVQQDLSNVVACPGGSCGSLLTTFSNVTATDQNSDSTDGLAAWDAVQVNTVNAGNVFVSPDSSITPTGGAVATTVCHRVHHHHRHFTRVCVTKVTGGGPSTFSVFTGTPTGV